MSGMRMGEWAPRIPPLVTVCMLSHRWRTHSELVAQAEASVRAQRFGGRLQFLAQRDEEYWPAKLDDIVGAARGRYFVVLPDDDELHPDFLQRHVSVAEATGADLVYSDIEIIGPSVEALGMPVFLPLPEFDAEVIRLNQAPYFTCLWRRTVWERLVARDGYGYDGRQPMLDWDFPLRACQLRDPAVTYRHLQREYLYRARSHAANGAKLQDNQAAIRKLREKHSTLLIEETHANG